MPKNNIPYIVIIIMFKIMQGTKKELNNQMAIYNSKYSGCIFRLNMTI